MTIAPIKQKHITLEEFLQQDYIDEAPAYEYINNEVVRKPMPKTHHSRIQIKLASLIESVLEKEKKLLHLQNYVVLLELDRLSLI